MKNYSVPKQKMPDPEQPDTMELKRRAVEDALKDADSYASDARPKRPKTKVADGLHPLSYLLTAKHARERVDSQDGIDGILIHPNEGATKLVLSDELLEITLPDEETALAVEPIKIFHIQAPAPWVEHVHPGKA